MVWFLIYYLVRGPEGSVLVSSTWPFLPKISVVFVQATKYSYANYILRYRKAATRLVHKYIRATV